jgi:hypothetical protein
MIDRPPLLACGYPEISDALSAGEMWVASLVMSLVAMILCGMRGTLGLSKVIAILALTLNGWLLLWSIFQTSLWDQLGVAHVLVVVPFFTGAAALALNKDAARYFNKNRRRKP